MCAFYQRLNSNKGQTLEMCCFWKKLQQWQNKVGNNGGQKVTLVAVAHLVIIVWGLILTFEDIHIQHYPFSLHEIVYVLGYYMVHLLLVASLVTGTFKEKPIWYVPWISIMFIVFSQPSVLWIQSLFNGAAYYFTDNVVNVTILSLVWFGWWTVIKHFWYMWSTRTYDEKI